MKKIFLAILVTLISVTVSNAGVIAQSINSNTDYSIECRFDEANNVFYVKLKTPVSGIVKVNVTGESGNTVETLIDSGMDEGEYIVCFKPSGQTSDRKLKCNMKVYSNDSGGLLYSNEIKVNK